MVSALDDSPFLNAWHNAMIVGAALMLVVCIAMYILYKVRVAAITDYKEKHDFLNKN
jgi:hypothetical protein